MKKRKMILSLVLSLLMLTPFINNSYVYALPDTETETSAAKSDVINIPDENLKTLILNSLGKNSDYELTASDLESIKYLSAFNYGSDKSDNEKISSLQGLEYCTNLTYLSLTSNNISDISPLSNLTNLKNLSLENNNIYDLSPLANLKNISYINLKNQSVNLDELNCYPGSFSFINPLTNIDNTAVTSLSNIQNGYYNSTDNKIYSGADDSMKITYNFNQDITLGTSSNTFSGIVTKNININKIVNIPDAKLRSIISNQLGKDSDYSITTKDMASITNLKNSLLSGANENDKISSLEGLEFCTNLTNISLAYNNISDLSPLKNLTNLKSLDLWSNKISNIEPLSNLINLEDLCLTQNSIKDITPINNLTNLTSLSLWSNNISDLSPLANLTNLKTLDLSENYKATDLSPLANLTSLNTLTIMQCNISNISPLKNLTNLTSLCLAFNSISDITPLANLTKLTYLGLQGNNISNVSTLSNLVNLDTLILSLNKISDISPLKNLSNISTLLLQFQSISLNDGKCPANSSLCFLNQVTNLDSNPVTSISDLVNAQYNAEQNMVTSSKLSSPIELSYKFNEEVTLGSAKTNFSGTVTKKIFLK